MRATAAAAAVTAHQLPYTGLAIEDDVYKSRLAY
jgi:hypothetical protein